MLERVNSKNDFDCDDFSDMLEEENDIKKEKSLPKPPEPKKLEKQKSNKNPPPKKEKPKLPTDITLEELKKHKTEDDAWIAVYDKVYDVTEYLQRHPGGKIMLQAAGTDGTSLFEHYHSWVKYDYLLKKWYKGPLKG